MRSKAVSNVKLETKNKKAMINNQQITSMACRKLNDLSGVFLPKNLKSKNNMLNANKGNEINENSVEKPPRLPMAM
ncbi:hypothetical protein SAMN05192589_108116 [Paracidovorax valerianellae]|uniref:Uncharacterized protein n=1 Tax=Paracidovorax valerianellae TaxID=187868 RepID=A0A1G6WXQ7_9BURK|nr:hypothetical protein SAMN05192589_108116 [Paracidovorax valerianellae]